MLLMMTEFTAVMLLLSIPSGIAIPLSSFYSSGSAAGDTLLPPNDDGSSPSITLPAPFLFFGANYSTVFVSLLYSSAAYMAMYIKDAFSFYCAL